MISKVEMKKFLIELFLRAKDWKLDIEDESDAEPPVAVEDDIDSSESSDKDKGLEFETPNKLNETE